MVPNRIISFVIFILVSTIVSQTRADELTDEEKQLVAKFRPMVKDAIYKKYMNTDEYLVRWLRPVSYDLEKAKVKLETAMTWRKENKMDSILTEDFSYFEKIHPMYVSGFDKAGHPLFMMHMGSVDLRKMILTGKKKDLMRYYERTLEIIERELHLTSANVTKFFVLLDMSGFSMKQHGCSQCLTVIPTILKTMDKYYPDRLYKYYMVNTPRIYSTVFQTLKPLLDKPTQKAIGVFPYNKDEWKKAILSEIDESQLPARFGGILPQNTLDKSFKEQMKNNKLLVRAFEKEDE